MQRLVSIAISSVLAAGCAGSSTQSPTAPSTANRAPSPGPRGENGINDEALGLAAADLTGRTGEDQTRARARLVTDQARAFLVAVVHAMPRQQTSVATGVASAPATAASGDGAIAADAAAAGPARASFDPPATLVQQLNAREECSPGGDAHRCAGKLGSSVLDAINGLPAQGEFAHVKESLLSALAALDETRVPVASEVRWRVLREGDDAAAHLAQALTLVLATRHLAQAIQIDCPCDESARLAGRLADELSIGGCADAFERMLVATEGDSTGRAGLATLAGGSCAPACAVTAFSGRGEDVVLEAARACRAETTEVRFAPFSDAANAIGDWSRTAQPRLVAMTNDPAVTAIMASNTILQPGAHLPLPPPLFHSGAGTVVEVPPVPGDGSTDLQARTASAIVWLPASGDALVTAAPRFTMDAPPEVATGRGPIDGLRERIDAVLASAHADPHTPVALVADRSTRAPRIVSVLEPLTHGAADPAHKLLTLAVRHGAFSRYLPLEVMTTAPDLVFRIGERQVTVMEHGNPTRVVALAAPTGNSDNLGGAITEAPPSGSFALQLEPDVSGATFARAVDALAVYGARSPTATVPGVVPTLAEGALTFAVADAAKATALRAAIDSHRADALRCFESVAAAPDGSPSRVDLHLVLNPRGRITRAETATDLPRSDTAATCVTTAARRWRLPASGPAAEVRVAYVVERPAAAPAIAPETPAATR